MKYEIPTVYKETPDPVRSLVYKGFPSFLANGNLRLIIFGGKGGTGKTTASCSTAIYLAHLYPAKRFLLVSSDPAHSLADSLGCPVGNSLTPVPGRPNLWAIEMDAKLMLEAFKQKHRLVLENLATMAHTTDQMDIRDFITFKLPGMEEMMVLLEIVKLLRFGIFRKWEYDTVIWDTAPTGHTLRLLELPGKLLEWIGIFNISVKRYRVISTGAATLGFKIHERRPPKGNVNKYIATLSHELDKIRAVLKDPDQSEFVPVTIPEAMGILETEDLMDSIIKLGIPNNHIVVNMIVPPTNCGFCSVKSAEHSNYLRALEEQIKTKDYVINRVPLFPYEIQGVENLGEIAEHLYGNK